MEPDLPSQRDCLMPPTFGMLQQGQIPFALSPKPHRVPENSSPDDDQVDDMILEFIVLQKYFISYCEIEVFH